MNATKFVITSVAAASFVGVVGLAFAQTNTPTPRSTTPNTPNQTNPAMPPTSADTGMPNSGNANGTQRDSTLQNSTDSMPATDSGSTPTERPARSDRN